MVKGRGMKRLLPILFLTLLQMLGQPSAYGMTIKYIRRVIIQFDKNQATLSKGNEELLRLFIEAGIKHCLAPPIGGRILIVEGLFSEAESAHILLAESRARGIRLWVESGWSDLSIVDVATSLNRARTRAPYWTEVSSSDLTADTVVIELACDPIVGQ